MGERIALRVDESRKAKWKDAVEENDEYSSLTQLIELAVHRELSGNSSSQPTSDTSGGYEPSVTNAELHDKLRDLHREMKGTAENVSMIKDEVTSSAVPERRQFFEQLPKSKEYAVSVDQLADTLEYTDVEHTQDVLDELVANTARVKTTTIAGETHYYKEV